MTRILLAGFEPFGGERVNPSHEVGTRLAREGWEGAQLDYVLLPVVRFVAVQQIVDAMLRFAPDAVMAMGQANGRARITPERIAINVDDFRVPDNALAHPRDARHDPDGPDAYCCTLPVRAMTDAMLSSGIPAAVSNTAGTFLCNHVAYGLLHTIAQRRLPVQAGFVHLPFLPEQAAAKQMEVPSMSLETMLHGLRAALGTVIANLTATGPGSLPQRLAR